MRLVFSVFDELSYWSNIQTEKTAVTQFEATFILNKHSP